MVKPRQGASLLKVSAKVTKSYYWQEFFKVRRPALLGDGSVFLLIKRLTLGNIIANHPLDRYQAPLSNGWNVVFNRSVTAVGECQDDGAVIDLYNLGWRIKHSTG